MNMDSGDPKPVPITPKDVQKALHLVEEKCGIETSNLLRNVIESLAGQIRVYEFERDQPMSDDHRVTWAGV